jgi:hypothetical protein
MSDVGDGEANLFEHLKSHVVRVAERVARSHDKSLTPKTAHALSELSFELTKSIARDVRAYANHAHSVARARTSRTGVDEKQTVKTTAGDGGGDGDVERDREGRRARDAAEDG